MPSFRFTANLIALSLAAAAVVATAAEPGDTRRFTAERVFDLEYGDDPQISPNGETIVYVRQSMDRLADRVRGDLWRIDVASGAHRPW